MAVFINPFKPGAGHSPPYLAGRDAEKNEFLKLLQQDVILSNMVLTGLRGVGKTVLLEELKPIAITNKWLWVGTDLSESTSVSEETIACRLLTDLSVVTSTILLNQPSPKIGFVPMPDSRAVSLDYNTLHSIYSAQAGLASDKLKAVLEAVWGWMSQLQVKGVVFAYDEAQTMSDHSEKNQFPLSLLLDVFQSIQRKGVPFMLVMTGLPTLFPKLVAARTYAERMFNIQFLGRLSDEDCREAIMRPIKKVDSAIQFKPDSVNLIIDKSGGYPYFVQFICKELFDVFLQQYTSMGGVGPIAMTGIIKKLDKDFFAGRWARATDRQRQLLTVIASLENCDEEFTTQEIVAASQKGENPFTSSHTNQMLSALIDSGLIYKNRHGRYAFAVPLLGDFIRRQEKDAYEGQQLKLPIREAHIKPPAV